jgi:hypothetical protein
MAYMSTKKGPLVAAISALLFGTLVSLGALFGLNKRYEPDEPMIESAASLAIKNPLPPGQLRPTGKTTPSTIRKHGESR